MGIQLSSCLADLIQQCRIYSPRELFVHSYSHILILWTPKHKWGLFMLLAWLLISFLFSACPIIHEVGMYLQKLSKKIWMDYLLNFFPGIFPGLCLVLIKIGGTHIALARIALNHFNKLTTEFSQMLQNLVLTICQHSKAFCSTGCVTKHSAHLVSFLNSWRKKNPLVVLLRILTYDSLIMKKFMHYQVYVVHVFSRISTLQMHSAHLQYRFFS